MFKNLYFKDPIFLHIISVFNENDIKGKFCWQNNVKMRIEDNSTANQNFNKVK